MMNENVLRFLSLKAFPNYSKAVVSIDNEMVTMKKSSGFTTFMNHVKIIKIA